MQHVFTAENLAEAHMIADQLERQGIKAHVHGEALQGAVGELQTGSLQVLVGDEDAEKARTLLAKWQDSPEEISRKVPKFPTLIAACFAAAGLFLGFTIKSAVDNSRISVLDLSTGYDQNGDGRDDVTYFNRLGESYFHKMEVDRNFDGAPDVVTYFDAIGAPIGDEVDDNFDRVFETRFEFENGVVTRSTVDTNRNRIPDQTNYFEHGVLRRTELFDERTGVMARIEHFDRDQFLERAEIDLDRDGFLETVRTFDRFGEIASTETRERGGQ